MDIRASRKEHAEVTAAESGEINFMNTWYYSDGERPVGPFEVTVLRQLRRSGIIEDHTKVSEAGAEAWRSYLEAVGTPPVDPVSVQAEEQSNAAAHFYLDAQRRPVGPLPKSGLQQLLEAGLIGVDTMVSKSGATEWVAAGGALGLSQRRLLPPPPAPEAVQDGLRPKFRPLEQYALLMAGTFTLYTFYILADNTRDLKAITGKPRLEFMSALVLGIVTLGIVPSVLLCLWAFDLEKHGETYSTPNRQASLGTMVLLLSLFNVGLLFADNWLAILLNAVVTFGSVWLLQKEINLYAHRHS